MMLPRQPTCHLSFAASSKQQPQQSPCTENSRILHFNRTQATVKSYQINSSPISAQKQEEYAPNEVNNKENQQSNYIKIEGSTFKDCAKMEASRRGALSPMPRLFQYRQYKKSLTPGHRSREEQDRQARNETTAKTYGTLNSSKNVQGLVGKGSVAHLQGSSSFKELIQNQCRSPSRFHHNTTNYMERKNRIQGDNVQQSLSQNTAANLESSGQDKPVSCFNNDGNNAKYRVVNKEQDGEELLYYCSKCTIPLVQQGFIVEELKLTPDTHDNGSLKRINEYKLKLRDKKDTIGHLHAQVNHKQAQAITNIQSYYQRLTVYLQSQKQSDLRSIQHYYSQCKQSYNQINYEISSQLEILENCSGSPKENIHTSHIQALLQRNQNFGKEITFTYLQNSQKLANFSNYFEQYLKPKIASQNKQKIEGRDLQNQSNALRFSFQRPFTNNNSKKNTTSSMMNPLQEYDNEESDNQMDTIEELQQKKSAFRTLFPSHEPENTNTSTRSPTFKNI